MCIEMFLKQLYPKKVIASVYELDWTELSTRYAGVIFDIDNTLVPQDAPADDRAAGLFRVIHGLGMKTMLLSNNKEARVKAFADKVGTGYLYKSGKPRKSGYLWAMKKMGTIPGNTLCIGDQIFSDVWGANRAGMHSILVKPMNPREEIQIVLKRYLEKPVLYCYLRRQRKGNI